MGASFSQYETIHYVERGIIVLGGTQMLLAPAFSASNMFATAAAPTPELLFLMSACGFINLIAAGCGHMITIYAVTPRQKRDAAAFGAAIYAIVFAFNQSWINAYPTTFNMSQIVAAMSMQGALSASYAWRAASIRVDEKTV